VTNSNFINRKKLKILIVDDSDLIIERLSALLQDQENVKAVLNARNYSQALSLIEKTTPDVVLLDINLPGLSGIDLLRTIKKTYKHITVIMVTNQVNDRYKTICKKLGAHYFFDKSNDFDFIPQIISSLAPASNEGL
jgi:DNA-binding NarL/FixJ family response regulator